VISDKYRELEEKKVFNNANFKGNVHSYIFINS
jgi:hypothetical protein